MSVFRVEVEHDTLAEGVKVSYIIFADTAEAALSNFLIVNPGFTNEEFFTEVKELVTFDRHQSQTPPGFGATVLVPSDNTLERHVFGSMQMMSGSLTARSINIEVETGIGTATYEIVQRLRVPGGIGGGTFYESFSFACPPGHRYRFSEDETGGSASIAQYNYRDVKW